MFESTIEDWWNKTTICIFPNKWWLLIASMVLFILVLGLGLGLGLKAQTIAYSYLRPSIKLNPNIARIFDKIQPTDKTTTWKDSVSIDYSGVGNFLFNLP